MRDFLPADVRRREYVIGVIKEVYERYGFEPLETPAVENIETLMGKYGEEGNQLIFKILKRGEHEKTGEADLALRYDLTVPLARVVAQYQNELPKFFKRYQIQPVWRADRPARGRFREFYQCDVDILGSRSMLVEAEICSAASEVLTKLGFSDFAIRLNHREILTSLLNVSGIPADRHGETLVALDKWEKIGSSGLVGLLQAGNPMNAANNLRSFIDEMGKLDNDERLNRLRAHLGADEKAQRALDELDSIMTLTKTNESSSRVRIDVSLARGLSYYTGSIMEISVDGIGSLGGGGRYDNLVGMFLGKDVPACGLSLGLERIFVVMSEREMFPSQVASSPADVMVSLWNGESASDSIVLAQELRSAGLRVDLYPDADKLAKQFKYASSRGISFVAVLGDEEKSRGEVAIKDLRSGEQQSVKRENVADTIRGQMK
jgi:histidyl-tRNA synthetase